MERVKFNEKELNVVKMAGAVPVFDSPITREENYLAMFRGENPLWMPFSTDAATLCSRLEADNISRAFVFDGGEPIEKNTENYGGPDMFGIEWVYVPVAGGSMVKPGSPLMEDANDWKELIKFPDIASWDWDLYAKMNEKYLDNDQVNQVMFLNGFMYERLISFMDFEGAAIAIIDEEQKDAVKELCQAMLDRVYIPYLEHVAKYLPQVKMVCLHDDWGAQRSPFFSLETAREMFVPLMQQFAAKCKELGLIFQLHSCGKNDMVVPAYIEGGVETWNGMWMNDKRNLFELYGDKIILGVDCPAIANDMEASDEDLYAAAKEFCEFYIRDGKCRVICNARVTNGKFLTYVYQISREMLN